MAPAGPPPTIAQVVLCGSGRFSSVDRTLDIRASVIGASVSCTFIAKPLVSIRTTVDELRTGGHGPALGDQPGHPSLAENHLAITPWL